MLSRAERQIKDEFIKVFVSLKMSLAQAEAAFIRLLKQGDLEGLLAALDLGHPVTDGVARLVIAAYITSGQRLVESLRLPRNPVTGMQVKGYYNASIPRAAAWSDDAVARLVTRVMEDQRQAIRQIIADGIAEGVNPDKLIKRIIGIPGPAGVRIGGGLGLTAQQGKALKAARDELANLSPDYFSRKLRDKRFDKQVKAAIEAGKPLTAAQIEKITAGYSHKMLVYRGEEIARTEYHSAVEAGKFDAMEETISSGKVSRQAVTKAWDSTGEDGRTRPDHLAMEGQKRPWDEPFRAPDGSLLRYPGDTGLGATGAQTIRCRCIMKVKVDRYSKLK